MLDRNSETWITLRRRICERIEKLRTDLETPGFPPEGARGEIAGLRWAIREVEPDAPISEPTSTDYLRVYDPS